MKIMLNGEEITSFCSTLQDLCLDNGFDNDAIATAMNGIFVPKDLRLNTILEDGDKIEVLVPLQGG